MTCLNCEEDYRCKQFPNKDYGGENCLAYYPTRGEGLDERILKILNCYFENTTEK